VIDPGVQKSRCRAASDGSTIRAGARRT
jgi:hypothetical protein